ncbi:class I SAM-dependent DNA methyltransferase [Nocardia cyriacigeorgica]|uniref:site-specific DNA-methyltransferase (adenine-specific) n=1 Tax=Nocardia cyriacigeorgica TaxID=135487 RepID=A0ABX0CQD3_9NOCA|nr:class I SAM-dependent DNA methyltransferase [Nocardia cyriacigeorgica]
MPSFDSIVVGEDWISEHYFTTDSVKESFHGRVLELRKGWDAEAKEGRGTVRGRFITAARDLHTTLAALAESAATAPKAHAQLREVFGYPGELTDFTAERAGSELLIPNAQLAGTPDVLFLQANPVDSLEDLLAPDTGRLITPATEDGKPIESLSKAVSAAFRSDTPPAFIVVQAGQWHLLAEAERWAEGRYLAVDLLVVAERKHEARGGEVDRAVAIFGYQSLKPDADGNIWWTGVLEDSVKHTVGVSKDLREGIRLSIEIIANEVVRRRRERGLTMDGIDGNELAKHSLRFLYRILFLLYAEASPEMQVLPTGAAEYEEGYGLDRLRELTLTELVSHRARTGTHLYLSLKKLFDLVDKGHEPAEREDITDDPAPGLQFNPLRADLFSPKATALIDEVGLGNEATRQVLEHLLLTKESKTRKGADRGFISYAELGINQLGAVYEGLMSYTGFFAEQDLYEVAKNGDPEKGSWVVPVDRADHLSESDFVRTEDPNTHEQKPVIHHKGTFVFRLAGRERQQSASYYTPEVLTKFVVSQALEELLDQNGARTTPEEILQFTICEPALGSGAFAIEAVRQLAAEYLARKQQDLGERIEPDQYPVELQKVKAHIALHQVYGVDLNATAVELAEISLWLDTMVAGLQAPWFGLHLRRGNSLIGARRAVYQPTELARKAWLKTVPKDVPLGEEIGAGIHHFLLPAQGWGAIIDTPEAKAHAPEKREELRLWRNEIRKAPSKDITKRLAGLAQRVETLWEFTLRRLTIAEASIRRDLHLWGTEPAEQVPAVTREQIEAVLYDENSAYRRLRRAMDLWCALWSWPVTTNSAAPDWDQWIGGLEAILGIQPKAGKYEKHGQISIAADLSWHDLDVAEDTDLTFAQALAIDRAVAAFPWLQVADNVARCQAFHHWELDFGQVFIQGGGFDLQVGNPPWVQSDWEESKVLAEYDPWWQLATKPPESAKAAKRDQAMSISAMRDEFLDERASQIGVNQHLGSGVDRPALAGLQPDMYRCFIERTWRSQSPAGIIGLIHPETHLTDIRAGAMRRQVYGRLRRHWQFKNELLLFDIDDKKEFGVNIYGAPSEISFLQGSTLYHPDTVARSFHHDGTGLPPGVKDPDGNWDLRPHSERIVRVTDSDLRVWASLINKPGTSHLEAHTLYPINQASASILRRISSVPRLNDLQHYWTRGWEEDRDRERGFIKLRSAVPRSWDAAVLQGIHISVANPLFKHPNETMRNNQDTTVIDLEHISESYIPRTSYQPNVPAKEYGSAYPKWDGMPSSSFYRLAWRAMGQPGNVRTLQAAILPPGPTHVNGIQSLYAGNNLNTAILAGMAASITVDYLFKAMGGNNINRGRIEKLPFIANHPLESHLLLRTLRLNCLVRPYEELWRELYRDSWVHDEWVPGVGVEHLNRSKLSLVGRDWTEATPLRNAADRRQALVEIDSIVAVMLDVTAEELATIYLTQFPVLKNEYEDKALYDANGRQLPTKLASEYRKKAGLPPTDPTVDGITYEEPIRGVDREHDMRLAHSHFTALAKDLQAGSEE